MKRMSPPTDVQASPVATPGVAKTAYREFIYRTRRFSDHAPLIIDYDYPLA